MELSKPSKSAKPSNPDADKASTKSGKINAARFYNEWKGHQIPDLEKFHSITLAERGDKPIIYLAGDSSLDNKYWVPGSGPGGDPLTVPIPSIYDATLDRPKPKPDVAFWMNHLLGEKATCINTSIEESMLRERDAKLLPQDEFIRDHIRPQDVLIVSVGANDVAMKPNLSTIWHMLQLAWFSSRKSIEAGKPSSLKYFKYLFGDKIQDYVQRIVEKQKPAAVVVCMIYFPLEAQAGYQKSWAGIQLKALGYDWWPGQLQAAIRQMYKMATENIIVDGTKVIPFKLFEVLDGKSKGEYTARVEPSADGGKSMAVKFQEVLSGLWGGKEANGGVSGDGLAY